MDPILSFEIYNLVSYRKAVKTLQIPCQGKEGFEQIILQDLLGCYLFTAIRIMRLLDVKSELHEIIERLSALALFNSNILWVYEFIYPLIRMQDRELIYGIIIKIKEFQELLNHPYQDPSSFKSKMDEHERYLSTLIDKPLPDINDPRCIDNGRLIISYSKDCLIDAMIIQLEHIISEGEVFYHNPNEETAERVSHVFKSIQHSLRNQIILRDYDAYIVQNLSQKNLDQGHLNRRNKPVQLLDSIQKILDTLQTDIPLFEDVDKVLTEINEYLTESQHGQLDN